MAYKGKILILDDEVDIVDFLLPQIKAGLSNEINGFNDVDVALDAIKKDSEYFIVLMDFMMPKKNGLEFAKEAIKLNATLKFIVMSGYMDNALVDECKNFGIIDYFNKPFDTEKIISKIKSILNNRLDELSIEIDLRNGFLEEMGDNFLEVENLILELESGSNTKEVVEHLFRLYHNLKGGGAAVGFRLLSEFSHKVENKLNDIRTGQLQISKEIIDYLFQVSDVIKNAFVLLKKDPTLENIEWYKFSGNSIKEVKAEPSKSVINPSVINSGENINKILIQKDLLVQNMQSIISEYKFKSNQRNELLIESNKIDTTGLQYLVSVTKMSAYDVDLKIKNQDIVNVIKLSGLGELLL